MDLRAMHTEQLGQHQPQAERVVQRGAVQVLRGEAWCQGPQGLHVRSPTKLVSRRAHCPCFLSDSSFTDPGRDFLGYESLSSRNVIECSDMSPSQPQVDYVRHHLRSPLGQDRPCTGTNLKQAICICKLKCDESAHHQKACHALRLCMAQATRAATLAFPRLRARLTC